MTTPRTAHAPRYVLCVAGRGGVQPCSLANPPCRCSHACPPRCSPVRLQLLEQRQADLLESQLGWPLFTEGDDKLGWLMNFTTVSLRRKVAATAAAGGPCKQRVGLVSMAV